MDASQPPSVGDFGESSPGGTEQAGSANPQMLGDSLSYTGGNPRRTSGGTVAQPFSIPGIGNGSIPPFATLYEPGPNNSFFTYVTSINNRGFVTTTIFPSTANTRGATGPAGGFSHANGTTVITGPAIASNTSTTPGGGTTVTNPFTGITYQTLIDLNRNTFAVQIPSLGLSSGFSEFFLRNPGLPLGGLAGSSFKTSDNESPRPEDRVFLATDYFTRVLHSVRDDQFGGPSPSVRLAREVFGFEKTFAGGDASVELRAPFYQVHVTDGTSLSDFGDITVLGKWAVVNEHDEDRDTVLTLGLALTVPTGPNDQIVGTTINPFIFQPYFGFLFGTRSFFVQGFSEMAFSFSDTVPTVWFNDIGVDYYAYRADGVVTAVVPTIEAHLTTPFGKQGSDSFPVGVIDTLVLTAGIHFVFAHHALLTFGYEFPVTGPQPFESEYVVQLNYGF
jgi:hypothetical protein